ncbi:MAG: phosphoribosyltransferase family protein [Candidatus Heimdallarchaeaceae archaeon]
MSSVDSYFDAKEKLMVLNLLRMVFKRFTTLEDLKTYLDNKGVEISIANLSRYINGKALPKSKLKDKLLKVLVGNRELGLDINLLTHKHIEIWPSEYGIAVNNGHILNDSKALNAILFMAIYKQFIPTDVDKVITAEVDGIVIASTLAHLLNIDCVYARKKKPTGSFRCLSEDIQSATSSRIETLYFPEKYIRKNERVIIIDDIIRSGSTQKALVNLVRKAGGIPVKVIILIGIGSHWEKITKLSNIPFKALTVVPCSES